jgi:general secretion pathway protein K
LKTRINHHSSRNGIALVLVMLTVIVLSAIVGGLAISMNTEIRLARNTGYDTQMVWMGRSGIELARYALANKCAEQKNIDALNQFWAGGTSPCSNDVENVPLKNFTLGPGVISVTIVDMERKWDINLIADPKHPQRDILQKALAEVGVTDAEQSSTIIDSILDWVNPNESAGFSGAKSDYYMHLDPPYYCKNGWIDDMSELLLIKGITPDIYWGSNSTNHPMSAFQQHGSGTFDQPTASRNGIGFNGGDLPQYPVGLVELFNAMGGKLNVNTASIKTLQLIPGIDEATAARIIEQRSGPDGQDGTDDDVPMQNPGEISSGLAGGIGANVPGAPGAGMAAQSLSQYVDVRSLVFQVTVEADINGYKRTYHGIVSRNPGGGGQQLQCVKFYWE